MRNIVAVLMLFAMCAVSFVSSGSDGGNTAKTDYGSYVLSMSIDAFIVVANEVAVSTDISLKETGTFERKEEVSFIEFSTAEPYNPECYPLFGPSEWSDDNQRLAYKHSTRRTHASSGYISATGAGLKILLPALC